MLACMQKKEPRKLGRPVTFKGDPESSQLSDKERKRIKRRIANRESARRVRQKRQVLMEELHCKVRSRRISSRTWHHDKLPLVTAHSSSVMYAFPSVVGEYVYWDIGHAQHCQLLW